MVFYKLHQEDERVMNVERISPAAIRSFFGKLVKMSFFDLGKEKDNVAAAYLTDMLTEFARTEKLYKISDSEGKKIQTIVEILLESQNIPEDSTESEREVRKYVGDFALFMSGIFRDYVNRGSYLRYYMNEGMKSYFVVSRIDLEMGKGDPIMFSRLSREFEFYSGALDYMRRVYFTQAGPTDPLSNFTYQISQLEH